MSDWYTKDLGEGYFDVEKKVDLSELKAGDTVVLRDGSKHTVEHVRYNGSRYRVTTITARPGLDVNCVDRYWLHTIDGEWNRGGGEEYPGDIVAIERKVVVEADSPAAREEMLTELTKMAQEDGEYAAPEPNEALKELFKDDPVSPNHYQGQGKQLWDTMKDLVPRERYLGFLQLNVQKYLVRYKEKNGVEDLKKARAYLNKLIEEEVDNADN